MIFRVIDCETTGTEEDAAVCEVACVDLNNEGDVIEALHALVHPGRPIPPTASAVHHITDDMVTSAYPLGDVLSVFADADCYVAHNDRFDRRYLGDFGRPWIDTYRCALRVWPDAPSHSNQALRYHLKTEAPPEHAGHAHRALYDAYTTAGIFRRLCASLAVEQMIEISSHPANLPCFRFGKHKGEPVAALPLGYLEWILDQGDFDEDVMFTAQREIKRRRENQDGVAKARAEYRTIRNKLLKHFDRETAGLLLDTPQAILNNQKPVDLIRAGKAKAVHSLVDEVISVLDAGTDAQRQPAEAS